MKSGALDRINSLLGSVRALKRHAERFYFGWRVRRITGAPSNSVRVNAKTRLTRETVVGTNFNSNGLTVLGQGKVEIGANFHCGSNCVILTENHNINGEALPYDSTYIRRNTKIGDNVWLGVNVTLLPGVELGEGVVVQAGSVVVSSIPPLALAGGHPARPFGFRNAAHYDRLKQLEMFH